MGEGGRLGGGSGRLYIVCFSDKQQSTSESWVPTTTSGEAGVLALETSIGGEVGGSMPVPKKQPQYTCATSTGY